MDLATLTLPSRPDRIAVILFGLECITTRIVLQELIAAGITVRLVCLPGRSSIPLLRTGQRQTLPMASGHVRQLTVATAARSAGIELWRIGDVDAPEVQHALTTIEAELVIVACYRRLIPAAFYLDRRFGGINLHPSLLPDKRGPDPLFWVFRDDDRHAGATVHRLTDRFDAGAILAQESIEKPDGISESELDESLARLGSKLILRTVEGLRSESINSIDQKDHDASWAPHPTSRDYQIDLSWSARRAFNFVRGVAERGHPINVHVSGQQSQVTEVHEWGSNADEPSATPEEAAVLHFADGWLLATLGK